MQTKLADFIKNTSEGKEADAILRSCVHCGFCLATCPTYQLLGDELDSPRGRIYLMKQVMEGHPVTQKTQYHLDRCLTCRACETTCPSGVRYSKLLDIGRNVVHNHVKRGIRERSIRYLLNKILPNQYLFKFLFKLGQFRLNRILLPAKFKKLIPSSPLKTKNWPAKRHQRTMLILDGCVQPELSPNINIATARVLDKLGISLIRAEQAGCCGALSYHLDAQQDGLNYMRRNIDAWWPFIDKQNNIQPIEAIVITASGCGVTVKEYGHLLRHDPAYAEKSAQISSLAKDISEILATEENSLKTLLQIDKSSHDRGKLAFHSPCTLQHGMQIRGIVEKILESAGFTLSAVKDSHLCCGSAGTYSILQPALSQQLLKNKITNLTADEPSQLVTANIGCLMHLQSGTSLSVRHWIEILDEILERDDFNKI